MSSESMYYQILFVAKLSLTFTIKCEKLFLRIPTLCMLVGKQLIVDLNECSGV